MSTTNKAEVQHERVGSEEPRMQSPAEIARLVELLDDEQWYDFLDELDAVTRRRGERQGEPDPSPGSDRDTVAAWIARKHFLVDSGVQEIGYLPHGAATDEIRLLEVSDRLATPARESPQIGAMDFGLNMEGNSFRLFVADVTSDELAQVRAGRLALPSGWTLEQGTAWRRRG